MMVVDPFIILAVMGSASDLSKSNINQIKVGRASLTSLSFKSWHCGFNNKNKN
uniref:Uncharacterized protein n=1 Tax=Anguilla anguilla TaxID=7936 RepID=A0A0E9PC26_ANGAN